jgi:hypothetical protein
MSDNPNNWDFGSNPAQITIADVTIMRLLTKTLTDPSRGG